MIHLLSAKTNETFCGNEKPYDILTGEAPPYNREVPKLCKECKQLRQQEIDDDTRRNLEAWNNRPPPTFHDRLVSWSHFSEDQMGVIGDIMLTVATLGAPLLLKQVAKWLLWMGV